MFNTVTAYEMKEMEVIYIMKQEKKFAPPPPIYFNNAIIYNILRILAYENPRFLS